MHLYLLRHGKAASASGALSDHDRPLLPAGRQAARGLCPLFRENGWSPQVVLCSSAVRTVETLEEVRAALPADVEISTEEELYLSTAEEMILRLRLLDPTVQSALVIGHNPTLQDLAIDLSKTANEKEVLGGRFPPGALVEIELELEDWKDLRSRSGKVKQFILPE